MNAGIPKRKERREKETRHPPGQQVGTVISHFSLDKTSYGDFQKCVHDKTFSSEKISVPPEKKGS